MLSLRLEKRRLPEFTQPKDSELREPVIILIMNKPYTPLVVIPSKFIPFTEEEKAIMARSAEKERLEREAFLRQMERDQARKRFWQKKQAEKRERDRQRNAYMSWWRKVRGLMDEGKTREEAEAIVGPYLDTGARNGFLNYGA